MDLTVVAYVIYLLISVALTVWVARTLSRNGRIFLADVLHGEQEARRTPSTTCWWSASTW
ncbi:hypothetical protein SBADM41S_02918 [Streptomyces badius]